MGPISSTFYKQLLQAQIPKAQKILSSHQSFFAILGSTRALNAAYKMLVKSTHVVNLVLHICLTLYGCFMTFQLGLSLLK